MGDMYEYPYDKNSSSSSSSQDEITVFLRQFLLRSSSSMDTINNAHNSTSIPGFCNTNTTHENALPPFQDGISALDSTVGRITASNRAFLSASGTFTSVSPNKGHGVSVANVSSSSIGVSENDTDDYDCESEEGVEALAEEVPTNSFPCRTRSSSKRSRAAEVHNLSEKRRRSRINEKLKALQNLIPNSNKTDKASMLDEAIEYLKQLQLQVQMLSMRNGLGLHPMCFTEGLYPLQLSRIRMELGEENSSIPLDMTATLPQHQENPLHYASNLPNKRTAVDQPSLPSSSYTTKSETSLALESPIPVHIRPFQPRRTSEICGQDILQHQQLKANHSDINPFGGSQDFESGTLATVHSPMISEHPQ